MKSRDRVHAAIEFEGPDRIPHMHSYRTATLTRYGSAFTDLLRAYPSDFYHPPHRRDTLEGSDAGSMTDEWGVTWVKIQDGYMGQPRGHPLLSWDALEDFEVPEPDPAGSTTLMHHGGGESIASEELYVCMYGGSVFEKLQQLRGMRNVFFDLARRDTRISRLADEIVEYNVRLSRIWLEAGADAIVFSDDWGTQERLMVDVGTWREFFGPRYRRMFRAVHGAAGKVHFHSDGHISPIIPDLIALGVDVLNPQLNAHSAGELAGICSGRICIRGGLDRQSVLPYGTVTDVRRHVRDAIESFAPHDGGWVACGELGPDVPLRNCRAMMDAFRRTGNYPRYHRPPS